MLFDSEQVFLNIVLDEAVEEKAGGEKIRIGMVVRQYCPLVSHLGRQILGSRLSTSFRTWQWLTLVCV